MTDNSLAQILFWKKRILWAALRLHGYTSPCTLLLAGLRDCRTLMASEACSWRGRHCGAGSVPGSETGLRHVSVAASALQSQGRSHDLRPESSVRLQAVPSSERAHYLMRHRGLVRPALSLTPPCTAGPYLASALSRRAPTL